MCLPQRSPRTFIIKTFHGKNLAARQEKSWLKKECLKKRQQKVDMNAYHIMKVDGNL